MNGSAIIQKASQPVRDLVVVVGVAVYLATQFGVKVPPVQPTNPTAMDVASREAFYAGMKRIDIITPQVASLYKWHDDGRDPDGGFLWYGKATMPLLETIIVQNREQTSVLKRIEVLLTRQLEGIQ